MSGLRAIIVFDQFGKKHHRANVFNLFKRNSGTAGAANTVTVTGHYVLGSHQPVVRNIVIGDLGETAGKVFNSFNVFCHIPSPL